MIYSTQLVVISFKFLSLISRVTYRFLEVMELNRKPKAGRKPAFKTVFDCSCENIAEAILENWNYKRAFMLPSAVLGSD